MSWTSGTTGAPKAFLLTHGNIATNVEALQKLGVVGRRARALLPLPMHHAYPFLVGVLTTLTIGTALVLPVDRVLHAAGTGRTDEERIADRLRQLVMALGAGADDVPEPAVVKPPANRIDRVIR